MNNPHIGSTLDVAHLAETGEVREVPTCGTTHYTGCACHEARRDALVAQLTAERDELGSQAIDRLMLVSTLRAKLAAAHGERDKMQGVPCWVVYCPRCKLVKASRASRAEARDEAKRSPYCPCCGFWEWERHLSVAKALVTYLEDDHGNAL